MSRVEAAAAAFEGHPGVTESFVPQTGLRDALHVLNRVVCVQVQGATMKSINMAS